MKRVNFEINIKQRGKLKVVSNEAFAKSTDNDSQIVSNAYYRFDIDVEAGDNINLQLKGTATAVTVNTINFVRAHLVQFGA